MVGAERCLSLELWVASLRYAGSAGNLQGSNDICQQTESPEAGRVVSQWRQLIGTGRRKWRDKRVKTERASKEGKWTLMWVGDYRQKAPAAACDLKKGRKVPVGGSPAWRLPKIERDRDQSRRSQAAPPRRSEGLLPPRLDRSPPLQEGTRQWEGSRRQLNLTYAPPSKDARCCPSQVNRTRPGECRECCGFRALEMDAGRVWKPLTTARSGSAEKLQARDKEVLLQAQDRDQAQAQTRRFVVPGLGKRAPSMMAGGSSVAGSAFEVALAVVVVNVVVLSVECVSRGRATRCACQSGLVPCGSFSPLKYAG